MSYGNHGNYNLEGSEHSSETYLAIWTLKLKELMFKSIIADINGTWMKVTILQLFHVLHGREIIIIYHSDLPSLYVTKTCDVWYYLLVLNLNKGT